MLKKLSFRQFWGGALIALPLYLLPGESFIDPRVVHDQFFFFVVCLSIVCYGVKLSNVRSFLALFIIWTFVKMSDVASGFVSYQTFMSFIGALFAVQFFGEYDYEKDKKYFLNVFSVMAIIQSLILILEILGFSFYNTMFHVLGMNVKMVNTFGASHFAGSLHNIFVSTTFLSILVPSLFRRKWVWFLPLAIFPLCMAREATPIGILTLYALMWLTRKNIKKFIIGMIFSLPILVLIYLKYMQGINFFSAGNRFEVWKKSFGLIHNWMFGHGLGFFVDNFTRTFGPVGNEIFLQAHNDYIEILISHGVIGLLIICFILLASFFRTNDNIIRLMLTGFAATMFFGFPFHISSIIAVGILTIIMGVKDGINISKQS